MNDLLPCPFCGRDVDGVIDVNEGVGYVPLYTVGCAPCDYMIGNPKHRDYNEAVAQWNRRPNPVWPDAKTANADGVA